MRTLKTNIPAWLVGVSLLWPGILCADLELELQTPVGKNILSWSPEQQLQGYGGMANIFPTRLYHGQWNGVVVAQRRTE